MNKQQRGLGKGLGALITHSEQVVSRETSGVRKVNINLIKPNRDQPRKYFDEERIQILSESIKEHGVLQPIILKTVDNGYEIVAGERRWRASRMAGLKEIPAVVKDLEDDQLVQISLIENLQREDLNQIEEALAYNSLIEEYGYTQEKVSKVVGKSRSHIANIIRLLALPEDIKHQIAKDEISGGHGRALATIHDPVLQRKLTERIIQEELSVRDIEKIVAALTGSRTKTAPQPASKVAFVDIEKRLNDRFASPIKIRSGKKKGRIEIEFFNEEDLDRIITLLCNE